MMAPSGPIGVFLKNATTGFITGFIAKSSEKLVVKARGEKGSEAYRCRSRTFFAENADP